MNFLRYVSKILEWNPSSNLNCIPITDCDLEAALIEKEALEKGWRQTEINGALCWVDRNGKIVEKKKFSSKHTEHVDSLDFDDENSELKSTIAQSTMQFFSG